MDTAGCTKIPPKYKRKHSLSQFPKSQKHLKYGYIFFFIQFLTQFGKCSVILSIFLNATLNTHLSSISIRTDLLNKLTKYIILFKITIN